MWPLEGSTAGGPTARYAPSAKPNRVRYSFRSKATVTARTGRTGFTAPWRVPPSALALPVRGLREVCCRIPRDGAGEAVGAAGCTPSHVPNNTRIRAAEVSLWPAVCAGAPMPESRRRKAATGKRVTFKAIKAAGRTFILAEFTTCLGWNRGNALVAGRCACNERHSGHRSFLYC